MTTAETTHAQRLWALDGATMTLENSLLVVGGQGQLTVPLPTFVIEHERGLVLFDTGLVPEAAGDPSAVYGEWFAEHAGIAFTLDQRVDRQLEAIGYRTDDITHVVLSHSHLDHTGGLGHFPNAEFFVIEGELPYAHWPYPAAAAFFRPADLEPVRAIGWNEVSGDHDLFGDGSIVLLHCPGHTPGNGSLLVRLPERTIILSGDTVHTRGALEADLPASPDANTELAVRSVRRIKHLAKSLDATIWITHDPNEWKAFEAPGSYT